MDIVVKDNRRLTQMPTNIHAERRKKYMSDLISLEIRKWYRLWF